MRAALIMIDMQNDVLAKLPDREEVVAACVAAAQGAKAAGLPVIYVQVLRRKDGSDNINHLTDEQLLVNKPIPLTNVEGTAGAELVPALLAESGDGYRVVKRRRSAFVGTDLDWFLRHLGVETVLVGGVATNLGVESTVRSAYDLGFKVIVLKDCCRGFRPADHTWALERIFPQMALVRSAAEAIALVKNGGDGGQYYPG